MSHKSSRARIKSTLEMFNFLCKIALQEYGLVTKSSFILSYDNFEPGPYRTMLYL